MNGNKLKILRENKGLLQKQLADKVGTSLSSISMYERGERQPDNETLKRIANFFDVSIDYLLDNIPIKSEVEEKETLRLLLIKNGYMKENEDLSVKELNKLLNFIKANKEFLRGNNEK